MRPARRLSSVVLPVCTKGATTNGQRSLQHPLEDGITLPVAALVHGDAELRVASSFAWGVLPDPLPPMSAATRPGRKVAWIPYSSCLRVEPTDWLLSQPSISTIDSKHQQQQQQQQRDEVLTNRAAAADQSPLPAHLVWLDDDGGAASAAGVAGGFRLGRAGDCSMPLIC